MNAGLKISIGPLNSASTNTNIVSLFLEWGVKDLDIEIFKLLSLH